MPAAEARRELGEFLRARRAQLAPEDVGLPTTGRRRTAGLRREEVAVLAGVSTTWYSCLEQGRANQASASVLDSVARVLRLGDAERAHLFVLAGETSPKLRTPPDVIDPAIVLVINALQYPAYLVSRHDDLQAWNAAAAALFGNWVMPDADADTGKPNLLHWVFAAPYARSLLVDWHRQANAVLARFRAAGARHPDDAHFAEVLRRARELSSEVDEMWSAHHVRASGAGTKVFRVPEVAVFEHHHVVFTVTGTGEQRLVVYTAAPGSPGEADFNTFCAQAGVQAEGVPS